MILTCPACTTRYQVPDVSFGGKSRKVRCKKCAHEWVIAPEATPAPQTPAAVEASTEPVAAREPRLSAAPANAAAATVTSVVGALSRSSRPRRSFVDRLASIGLAVVIMGAILFALWAFRTAIVRAWPPAAGAYAAVGVPVNIAGIEIRNSAWQIVQQNGTPVLTVNGELTNVAGRGVTIPKLRLALRDDKARLLYQWIVVLDLKRLNAGETARFTTSLPSPPLEAHDVQIRFETGT